MAKEKKVAEGKPEEFLSKESTDTQVPIDSGDWVDSLKNGDLLYSAGYEKDEEGNEKVKVLTLKFIEYDKKSVTDKNTRMATLKPIVDGKETDKINIPNQNLRVGFFPSKLEAVKAFEKSITHIAEVIHETAEKMAKEEMKKGETKNVRL